MGTLNLATLITEIRAFHAGRSDLTDEVIITQLNLVQERLARLWQWEELYLTETKNIAITSDAAADKILVLSQTFRDITSIRLITADGGSRKLEYIGTRSFDKLYPEPEFHARGDPRIYIQLDTHTIELYPVPLTADSLKLRGTSWATAFSSSSTGSKSSFDRKDDILIYWACSLIWDRLGEYERAKRFFGVANQMIDQAKDEQETKPDREIKPLFETGRGSGLPGNYWYDPFIRNVR